MTKNIFAESRLIFKGDEIPNRLVEVEKPKPENPFNLAKKLESEFEYSLRSENTKLSLAAQNPNLQKYFKEQQKKYALDPNSQQAALKNISEKFNPDELLNTNISAKLDLFGQQLKLEGSTDPSRFQAEKLGLDLKLGGNSLNTDYDIQKKEFSAKLELGENLSFLGDSAGNTEIGFSTENFTGKIDRSFDGKVKISGTFTNKNSAVKISLSEDEITAGITKGGFSVKAIYNPEEDSRVEVNYTVAKW